LKLKISPEHYNELVDLPVCKGNNAKQHVEIIGKARVSYCFYPNGTVMVFVECSNNPFKLEVEDDRNSLLVFFGQVRDRLVTFLSDTHERIIVPQILEWYMAQCEINKDIKVNEILQITVLKIQVKDYDHLFRIYINSIGKDTFCRVEKSLNPKKPLIQAINEIFHPPNNPNNNPNAESLQSSSSSFPHKEDRQ
jgi:hypothetical protein